MPPFLLPLWGILSAGWKAVSGFGSTIASIFNDLPNWLKTTIVVLVAVALWSWWLGQHEYDRGLAAQKAVDAASLKQCQDNVDVLKAGIAGQNAAIDAAAKAGADDAAAATQRAIDALKAGDASRQRETERGSGADAMNEYLRETFP